MKQGTLTVIPAILAVLFAGGAKAQQIPNNGKATALIQHLAAEIKKNPDKITSQVHMEPKCIGIPHGYVDTYVKQFLLDGKQFAIRYTDMAAEKCNINSDGNIGKEDVLTINVKYTDPETRERKDEEFLDASLNGIRLNGRDNHRDKAYGVYAIAGGTRTLWKDETTGKDVSRYHPFAAFDVPKAHQEYMGLVLQALEEILNLPCSTPISDPDVLKLIELMQAHPDKDKGMQLNEDWLMIEYAGYLRTITYVDTQSDHEVNAGDAVDITIVDRRYGEEKVMKFGFGLDAFMHLPCNRTDLPEQGIPDYARSNFKGETFDYQPYNETNDEIKEAEREKARRALKREIRILIDYLSD